MITSENAFKPLLSRHTNTQRPVPRSVSFPCNNDVPARSPIPPTSVHQLRPGDIDVVAAIGDSLTAGDAALEDSALGIFIQYRGVSWCIGGQGTWRTYLTLPNIIKHFNANVTGYSIGEGSFQAKNSRFNIAMPAALDEDTLKQARILVARIRKDPKINFRNSWKFVTIFIGHNDLCSKACFDAASHTAAQHAAQLRRALDFLQRNLPRTFVSLVSVADVTFSLKLQRSMMCRMLHPLLCACLHRGPYSQPAAWVANLSREYARAERELWLT
ncbi:hypothetical protein B566_EDAN013293 [Ephemera danica]|nr:hypothetical protein B566_EDAN013293 [Ephemera danica]